MARVPPFDRPAAYDDLVRLPYHLVGEILDGELHANPRPAPRIAGIAVVLGERLRRGLAEGTGPESWQLLAEPELHLGADILIPGLAAWRVSRLPELPATAYFSVPPDWVCESLASSTASFRARKMAAYAGEGVAHAWLIDPDAHALEVCRLGDGRWIVLATHVGARVVRAEPFEALELPLAALWPGESDDRPARRR